MSRIQAENLTKLYYSIGEVADMFEVNASLIRFWEKEFSAIQPKKNKKGNRLFTAKDILVIDTVYYLVKDKGFTLDGARNELKKAMKNNRADQGHIANEKASEEILIKKLESIRDRLLQLKSNSN